MKYYECEDGVLHCGDSKDILKTLPDNSVTAIVTDPPYGLSAPKNSGTKSSGGFMGKKWDYDVPSKEMFAEMLRVLKPGGTMLCFAGSRTQHRMAVNVEDAGFILKDTIMWIYGSGFPKSLNIGKSVDKSQGNERIKTGEIKVHAQKGVAIAEERGAIGGGAFGQAKEEEVTVGTSGWDTHGTALKPAYEPIILAMKPNDKTYANNALVHGVAGLNIDGCRIGHDEPEIFTNRTAPKSNGEKIGKFAENGKLASPNPSGRFPANILLDSKAGAMLDEQSGTSKSTGGSANTEPTNADSKIYGFAKYPNMHKSGAHHNDKGGASRFFYCAKASKSERNAGMGEKWLDSIEIVISLVSNTESEVVIWNEKIIMAEEQKVRHLMDMELSAERAIAEYGIQVKKGIDLNIISYGKKTLERYLLDTKFTTKMEINSITRQQILNLLHLFTTKEYTQDVFLKTMVGGSRVVNAENSNILVITINEKMGYLLGANPVALKMQFIIKESEMVNIHSTVKPLSLMTYLTKLVKMPEETIILDPFAGSGSTLIACVRNDIKFIGIEMEAEYCEIAKCRIEHSINNRVEEQLKLDI